MIHDPCDHRATNTKNMCHDDKGECTKHFPYTCNEKSFINAKNDLILKRDQNKCYLYKNTVINSGDVISYNPYLLMKYSCHINVDICKSSSASKYLFKYIYKGYDSAEFIIEKDEIKQYMYGRYLSGIESIFRLYGLTTSGFSHAFVHLKFHLENETTEFCRAENSANSMLLEFFKTVKKENITNLTYV